MRQSPQETVRAPVHRRVELSRDSRFARRIVRLAHTSLVALGLLCWLTHATLPAAPRLLETSLPLGWITMPLVLLLSLSVPALRYALVVPASLVTIPLFAICYAYLPDSEPARWGWLLLTSGVAMGGVLGAWFWFGIAPVPQALLDPFSRGRVLLITIHVALIVAGAALAFLCQLPA